MLRNARLLALLPVLVLALAGCSTARTAPLSTAAPAATDYSTPQTGTLDTSLPDASPSASGGSLDSGNGTPAASVKPGSLIAATGSDRAYLVEVVQEFPFSKTQQTQALGFAREVCDSEVNYADEQEDAIENADHAFDDDSTNAELATFAEDTICKGGSLAVATSATRTYVRAMHSINWVVASTSGRMSVTWDEDGDISQANGIASPWRKSFDDSSTVTLTAQNGGGGVISCYKVNADGSKYDSHSSTGAYAVVTCS